ncbi:hypothetical protein ODJ79_09450 [Actinoplanes sp. KI2]|uniref:hypothetical protein n=1 Tax=Actinoplanes sp. KI2 TaxID=2983315 RepID=UPI0021D59996|nr:hypothetical protein [Actinoplanes sp. KI2]MCU7723939.1 hypothetical protein [Actinoplanes sp. KI2]
MALLSSLATGMTVVLLGAPAGAPCPPAEPGGYQVVDLGTLGGQSSDAAAMNDRGEVVGVADTVDNGRHPFLWRHGAMADLGLPPGANYAWATDVNNRGMVTVTGITLFSSPRWHAFAWRRGTVIDLGTLGGDSSGSDAVNDRDQVLGWSFPPDGTAVRHTTLWDGGALTDLGEFYARDLNDRGEVVGTRYLPSGVLRGCRWADGELTDVDTLGGAAGDARAVNERGDIVGGADTADGRRHAFVRRAGVMTDLGTLGGVSSQADAVNDRGDIIGTADTAGGPRHPFLWQHGVMTDLTTRGVPADATLVAINNRGQLAGTYQRHAVRYTPSRREP